jgi:hypothetical protein
MKITDDIVRAACNAYDDYNKEHGNVLLRGVATGHGIKAALEAAMKTTWIKFDIDDESTWPPLDSGSSIRSIRVITNGGDICLFIHTSKQWVYPLNHEIYTVTHWTHLPVYRGE